MSVQPNAIPGINLSCKCVIFGKSKSGESEVIIDTKSITFWGTNTATNEKAMISINSEQIAKLIYCYSERTIVFLIFPIPKAVHDIQMDLSLDPNFFRPCSINAGVSRIFVLFDGCSDAQELEKLLKSMLSYKMEQMSLNDAKYVLKDYEDMISDLDKSIPVEVTNGNNNHRIILRYPPYGSRSISIYVNDYLDLQPRTYLNDSIIDFYLKYFTMEKTSAAYRDEIHVFDSFFYTKLSAPDERDPSIILTEHEKKEKIFERVAKWNEKVKLFEKKFIFVPINIHEHWFLAVICYPYLKGRVLHRDTGEEIDPKLDKHSPVIQSCILIFDSLGLDRPNVLKFLRIYLTQRYTFENNGDKIFDFNSKVIPGCYVKSPRQPNYYDCGVFLLQSFESFYQNPIKDFRTPIKGLEKWFEQDVIRSKRKYIKELIEELVTKYEPNNLPLPNIDFNCNEVETMLEFEDSPDVTILE